MPRLPNTIELHVDRGAEVVGDPLLAAVEHGALGVPRVEDRAHRQVELLARVLREVAAGVLADQPLVRRDEPLQVVGGEVEVGLGAALLLQRVQRVGEQLAVDAEHGAAEHLTAAGGRSPRRTARRSPAAPARRPTRR